MEDIVHFQRISMALPTYISGHKKPLDSNATLFIIKDLPCTFDWLKAQHKE